MGHEAPTAAALGVYKPRRPQESPLFRLVQDHLHRLQTVYDERFARIRCDGCAHEYRAVVSRTMPAANKTGITDAERELLDRWVQGRRYNRR